MSIKQLHGYTLIEVLVAITIIAVLAAILAPVLSNARGGALESVDIQRLQQIGLAASLYEADHSVTVANSQVLVAAGFIKPEILSSPADTSKIGMANLNRKKQNGVSLLPLTAYKDSYPVALDNIAEIVIPKLRQVPNAGWMIAIGRHEHSMEHELGFKGIYHRLRFDGSVKAAHYQKTFNEQGIEIFSIPWCMCECDIAKIWKEY